MDNENHRRIVPLLNTTITKNILNSVRSDKSDKSHLSQLNSNEAVLILNPYESEEEKHPEESSFADNNTQFFTRKRYENDLDERQILAIDKNMKIGYREHYRP